MIRFSMRYTVVFKRLILIFSLTCLIGNSVKAQYDSSYNFMKQYHGVGISILNDKLGAFVHQRVA